MILRTAHLGLTLTWGFPNIMGTLFGGPHNKDFSILGSILGYPYFGKLPYGDSSLPLHDDMPV